MAHGDRYRIHRTKYDAYSRQVHEEVRTWPRALAHAFEDDGAPVFVERQAPGGPWRQILRFERTAEDTVELHLLLPTASVIRPANRIREGT